MGPKTLKKIDIFIVGYGVLLCAGAAVLFDLSVFYSVLAGAAIALLNWLATRWLGIRMIMTASKHKMALLMGAKTIVTLSLIGVVFTYTSVRPIAFLLGLSALVVGVLSNSAVEAIAEGDKALREER
ncbi:MAG: ATP synthase subunit I [Deltaproteobacteria bacterium]|nr:ATP synthase subunit I [Deltaproteobacteria bacterium]MBN2673677.1 ATP synthase subunit I [Deltaproteobacteria bacterium]